MRCCSIYIPMLHYIVFPYICDVALKVFRALWDRGAVGKRGALGNEVRGAVGNRGPGAVDTIPFHSVPI
jgi:hypothetical protein